MKAILLYRNRIWSTIALLIGLLFSGYTYSQGSDPVTITPDFTAECNPDNATEAGPHDLIYVGRHLNQTDGVCKTYFFYCVVNKANDVENSHDISHTSFGDELCSNTCLNIPNSGVVLAVAEPISIPVRSKQDNFNNPSGVASRVHTDLPSAVYDNRGKGEEVGAE